MVLKVERERCTFIPPTDNPCQTKTQTHNLSDSETFRLSTFRPRLTPGVTGVNLVQLENKQLKIEHFYFAIAWQYGKIIKF